MMTPNEHQTLTILAHAVKTEDLNLAARAMRAYDALLKAETRLDRMAAAYVPLTWDSVESK